MALRILIGLIFSCAGMSAFADFSAFDISNQPDLYSKENLFKGATSKGMIWGSTEKFPTLRRSLRVEIPKGVRGVSHPSFFTGESGFTLFRSRYECNYNTPLKGDLIYVKDGVAAVRLDSHQGCQAGKLNSSQGAKDVVFFKTDQVQSTGEFATASTWDDSDSATEAGLQAPKNPSLHNSSHGGIDPTLNAMILEYAEKQENENLPANQRAAKSMKSREEMSVFMQVNCTAHQPDFKIVYEKLIHLSEKSFTLAYFPHSKRTEKFTAENNPFESRKDGPRGKEFPYVVRPEPLAISCIARRESRWDKNARSQTGAVGVGQQTTTNVKDLECFVYGCGKQKRKEWAYKAWNEYHDRAEKDFPRKKYPKLYENTMTGKPCDRELKSKDQVGFCPISSIGGIALYQVIVEQDIYQVTDSFNQDAIENNSTGLSNAERLELLEVLATSHNSGRTVARLAAEGKKSKNWADTLSKMRGTDRGDGGREVREYHKIMENCLESGSDMNFAPKDGLNQCRHIVEKRGFRSDLGLMDRINYGDDEVNETEVVPPLHKIPIPGVNPRGVR